MSSVFCITMRHLHSLISFISILCLRVGNLIINSKLECQERSLGFKASFKRPFSHFHYQNV